MRAKRNGGLSRNLNSIIFIHINFKINKILNVIKFAGETHEKQPNTIEEELVISW